MGRERALATARRPGAEEVVGRRPARSTERCASPGCEEAPGPGGRFCEAHQEVLDRVRAELESEARSADPRRGRRGPGA